VSHVYEASGSEIESFITTVTAVDTGGAEGILNVLVSLNNTPPEVEIISLDEGQLYSIEEPTILDLVLEVRDTEERVEDLEYHWEYLLHHNTHFHLLEEYDFLTGSVLVNPTSCESDDTYWYEFNVKVTDRGGLTAFDRKMIYPDCEGKLEPSDSVKYNLFPNPVIDEFTVRSNQAFGEEVEYRIYNTVGTQIRKDRIKVYNERWYFRVSTTSMENGVYIIEIIDRGKTRRIRFVKV
jgi:hypothetical protein